MVAFATPVFLALLLPVSAILIYLHMRFANRKQVVVGTLFILKQIQHRASSRAKLAFPWRLLFDLLLCALLVLSLAEIYLRQQGEEAAILLDDSLSMSAFLNDGSNRSRFDLAKEQIASIVRGSPNKFSLWLTSNQNLAAVLTSENVENVLAKFAPVRQQDELNLKLRNVLESKEIERLLIFSDRLIENEHALFETASSIIEFHSLPNFPIENIALQSVRLIEANLLEVKAVGFLRSPIQVKISARTETGQEVVTREFSLSADKQLNVVLPIDQERVFRNLEVSISPLKTRPTELINAIALDDSLSLFGDPKANNDQIFFVSSEKTNALGIDRFSFRLLASEELETISKNSDSLLSIFYKSSVPDSYRGRALLILPSDGRYFKKKVAVQNAKTTYLAETTRPLFYLKPTDLQFKNLINYELNIFGETLLKTDKATALSLLKTQNAEFLLYSFDLLPFEGRQNAVSSILFLNGLNWLREDSNSKLFSLNQQSFFEEESNTLKPKPIFLDIFQPNRKKLEAKDNIKSSLIGKLTLLFLGLVCLDLLFFLFNYLRRQAR